MITPHLSRAGWFFAATVVAIICGVPERPADSSRDLGRVYSAAIVVPDLDSTISWYQQHLGFRKDETMSFPRVRIAFLRTSGLRLEVVEDKRAFTRAAMQKQIAEMEGLDNPMVGIAKLGFCLNDFDASATRLKSEGVKFQIGIIKARADWPRSFIVLDNNQNWIQFFDCSN